MTSYVHRICKIKLRRDAHSRIFDFCPSGDFVDNYVLFSWAENLKRSTGTSKKAHNGLQNCPKIRQCASLCNFIL